MDLAMATGDLATTVCGPMGPFGSYTSVQGGQSGVTACGHQFTAFTGATLTLTQSAGGGLLTVTGTGAIGDVTDCPATVNIGSTCDVTATACPTGSSSTVTYTLTSFFHSIMGRAQLQIPGPGGGCSFGYDIAGTR